MSQITKRKSTDELHRLISAALLLLDSKNIHSSTSTNYRTVYKKIKAIYCFIVILKFNSKITKINTKCSLFYKNIKFSAIPKIRVKDLTTILNFASKVIPKI